jgi:heat shock protein HtpX
MPLTFIDIEKQTTWRISILFFVLILIYFLVVLALVQGVLFIFPVHFLVSGTIFYWGSPLKLLIIFGFSLLLAAMHFGFSAFGAVGSLMKNLEAIPPDPQDGLHRRLMNIVDELQVVTGRTKKVECMVIPSLSMNAVAASDLNGNAAIAITEGLLSRLTRPQLEAVIAHEAYHIISNDCLEATIATSLFGMYAAMLEKLADFGDDERRGLHPAFFLLWILVKVSQIVSMFISREREYRADAASVRMTRNPVAMAEALYLISRNWRGSGIISNGLEMLCIISPRDSELDESEGFLADLMSTHPPIRKRIGVLLGMVHISLPDLEAKMQARESNGQATSSAEIFYALSPSQQWKGPYSFTELGALSWFTPRSWISRAPGQNIERASENDMIKSLFEARLYKSHETTGRVSCPACRQPLLQVPYERTHVYQCHFCRGTLVENDKIPRIIARREQGCTERVLSLARAVIADNQRNMTLKTLQGRAGDPHPATLCPLCKNPMLRTFYSLAYLIAIDRCSLCNVTWFDADELEMLQCLIENRITAEFIP